MVEYVIFIWKKSCHDLKYFLKHNDWLNIYEVYLFEIIYIYGGNVNNSIKFFL